MWYTVGVVPVAGRAVSRSTSPAVAFGCRAGVSGGLAGRRAVSRACRASSFWWCSRKTIKPHHRRPAPARGWVWFLFFGLLVLVTRRPCRCACLYRADVHGRGRADVHMVPGTPRRPSPAPRPANGLLRGIRRHPPVTLEVKIIMVFGNRLLHPPLVDAYPTYFLRSHLIILGVSLSMQRPLGKAIFF